MMRVWRLSVCLSVAYIGLKSRTERLRKTKIGTEVAHITRDSDTVFKVKRSRSPGRFAHRRVGASGSCSSGPGNVLAVRNCCYVAVCSAALQCARGEERGGEYCGGRPPTACCNNRRPRHFPMLLLDLSGWGLLRSYMIKHGLVVSTCQVIC